MRLERLERLADRALGGLAFAGVLLLMAGVAALMVDICARKTVGFSILGIIDLTQLAQMACVFLVLPLAFLRESHIAIDFITERLPERVRAAIEVGSALLGVALLAALVWYSWGQAANLPAISRPSPTAARNRIGRDTPSLFYRSRISITTPLVAMSRTA